MKRSFSVFVASCLVLPLLFAQIQSARLEGTVQDSSGAVVPGAKLTIVNNRTQVRLDAEATSAGTYIYPVLPPGFYTLTVESTGFRKTTVNNIEVNIGVTLRQDITLELGTVTDTIMVESGSVRVQTTEATIQRAITLRDIDTLPQLARNPIALATYQPGVQLGTSPNDPSFARVNGMRQGSNNNTLDGIDVNDAVSPRLGLTMNASNTDSVEEFRIITNGAKAEYGRNAGGTVELITRSGTNIFHGNLFEYHRNTVLNANNFFNKSNGVELLRPKFIQNQFGGSFGGPVTIPKVFKGKDKLFFFYNYQGSRVAQEVVRNRTVLTPEAKAGVFRWIVPAGQPGAGETRSFDIVRNDPRGIGIDRQVAGNLALLPPPNNFDVGDRLNTAGFRFNAPANNNGDQHTFKTDWQATQKIRAYFRYSWFKTVTLADSLNNAEATFPGQPNGTQGGIRSGYSTGVNWTINPRLVNDFVLGYSESSVTFGRVRSVTYPGQALISANLFTNPIPTGFGSSRNSPVNPQIADNLSIIKGNHTYKTGFRFSSILQWQTNDANIWPNIAVGQGNGNAAPGNIGPAGAQIAAADRQRFDNLYNDLLGRVSAINTTFYSDLTTFAAGKPRVRNFIFRDYAYYFQDDWRVRKNLTLNIGLRYEFYGVPFERDKLQGNIVQAASGLVNTVGQISDLTVARSNSWFKNDKNNFAPRFGFAWSPFADQKTSVRGSWGLFYDRVVGTATIDPDSTTPGFAQAISVFPNSAAGSDVRASDRSLVFPAPPATPTLTPAATRTFGAINLFDPNFRQPYVMQLNLTVQREIARNTVVEAGYVSNRGVKQLLDQNVNQTRIYGSGFLRDFNELRAFQANNTAPSAGNALVRMFDTPTAAINAIGATPVRQGAVGAAANTIDTNSFSRYAAAGLSPFYLRNFPQFTNVWLSTNAGRTAYDSLQLSLRRQAGALKGAINYTWSKTIDNASIDGGGNTGPLDNYNFSLMRGRSDADRPHTLNWSAAYTLPIGRGKFIGRNMPGWVDRFAAGWEVGSLGILTSGQPLSISSGVLTGPNTTDFGPLASNIGSLADYNGTDRSIGKIERFGGGVRFFTPAQLALFSVPAPGSVGNSGRNTFRGPGFFNTDLSIVKRFRITEQAHATFRTEAYNLFNTVNFLAPAVNLQTPQTFGVISGTPTGASNQSGARILQFALRFDF
ncbi:MAG: TonB-dependent receptor [Bryobacteraceae bacterium]|nr:TonB-dependent receptor [Bryobacteraceae bacterium]